MKNNKGFTLVEVIISIGALGIICAVLLRLFVLAGDTNDMTADRQMAELYAASAAETLLCANTLDEGLRLWAQWQARTARMCWNRTATRYRCA
jgi:prepilin-type N-terminal cleavage/methylation domain-containing protein